MAKGREDGNMLQIFGEHSANSIAEKKYLRVVQGHKGPNSEKNCYSGRALKVNGIKTHASNSACA